MTMKQIRHYLRQQEDGARIQQIAKAVNRRDDAVRSALQGMPDAYIDRWERSPGAGGFGPIWCVVDVPEHCPKPERT